MTLLNIPQPCHQPYDEMTPVESGRHCATCSTTVVDLTAMPRAEGERFIARMESGDLRGEHVCVKAQVDRRGRLRAGLTSRRLLTNGLALMLGMSLAGCHEHTAVGMVRQPGPTQGPPEDGPVVGTVATDDGPTTPAPEDLPPILDTEVGTVHHADDEPKPPAEDPPGRSHTAPPVVGTVRRVEGRPTTAPPTADPTPEAPMPKPPKPREAPPLDLDADAPPSDVGTATVLADGTLQLQLRSETPQGIAEALMIVPPTDARYPAMLKHLGNPKPGDSCKIPPFPAPEVDPESIK